MQVGVLFEDRGNDGVVLNGCFLYALVNACSGPQPIHDRRPIKHHHSVHKVLLLVAHAIGMDQ